MQAFSQNKIRILTIVGTRPEVIKMAPVIKALGDHGQFESNLCVTGQHKEMLSQALEAFQLIPDFTLDVMKPGQTLTELMAALLIGIGPILQNAKPDLVLVHGDTATTISAALASFNEHIPVGHVEAGLRTYNNDAPWPEEANRRITDLITQYYFPPTEQAKKNLLNEGINEDNICVTGNTVIDALFFTTRELNNSETLRQLVDARLPKLDQSKKMILVTGHRRENIGHGINNLCEALKQLAQRGDVEIVFPVHLNPRVKEVVFAELDGVKNVHILPPLDYIAFVRCMSRAYLVITDSGGIQEEAPALDIPVLLTRLTTERPEAIQAGTVKITGNQTQDIIYDSETLLDDAAAHKRMAFAGNPYGDGHATDRIVEFLTSRLSRP